MQVSSPRCQRVRQANFDRKRLNFPSSLSGTHGTFSGQAVVCHPWYRHTMVTLTVMPEMLQARLCSPGTDDKRQPAKLENTNELRQTVSIIVCMADVRSRYFAHKS